MSGAGPVVLGVDGGGTSTRARICDLAGRALWEGAGEGINPNSVAARQRTERLVALLGEGLAAAGIRAREVAAACLGIAGTDRPSEKAEWEQVLRERLLPDCPLLVTTDADVALVGAHAQPQGLLLVCGTGSIALGRLADGTRVRAGGFGHFLGDEGSAFFIGFQAIRRTLRSMEGRDESTGMLPALLERFSLAEPGLFVPLVYQRFDKASIAACASMVEEFRERADPLAAAIFEEAADGLVELVSSVYRRLRGGMVRPALALQGGLVENNAWLRAAVVSRLARLHAEIRMTASAQGPAYGACLLAAGLVGAVFSSA